MLSIFVCERTILRMMSTFVVFGVILIYFPVSVLGRLHYAPTDMGTIIGKLETTHFREKTYQYVSYLGIPYAEESLDFWRFRKPRVPKRFLVPYNATYIRPSCLQIGYGRTRQKTSENCLFLNIYAPSESTINPVKTFPVLIYFHGGDFKVGSANDASPEVLSSYGDLIVVTVNYRLGVFGFLSAGDDSSRGNFGLWDQHFAIRWIRYNIAAFGGDFDNISLLGQTAGAASALYQGLYPGNRGLFQRIIAINGNSLSPWAINPPLSAELIGHKLDCVRPDDEGLIDNHSTIGCIKDTPSNELLKVGADLDHVGPTVDGEFLTEHPAKLLAPQLTSNVSDAYKFFHSLDIIIGFNENNGDILLNEIVLAHSNETNLDNFEIERGPFKYAYIPKLLRPLYDAHKAVNDREVSFISASHVEQVVIYQYTNWTDTESSDYMKRSLQNISRELNFFIPSLSIVDEHLRSDGNGSTYLFRFDYRASFPMWDSLWTSRVGVDLETLFVFGLSTRMTQDLDLQRSSLTQWEFDLSENMMKWVSNFAKTGCLVSKHVNRQLTEPDPLKFLGNRYLDPNKPSPILGNTTTPAWNITSNRWSRRPFEKQPVTWPKYNQSRTLITFSTNTTSLSISDLPGEPVTSFWLVLIPALLQDEAVTLFAVPPGIPEDIKPFVSGIDIPMTEARSVIVGLVAIAGGLLVSIVAIVCYVCKVFC